MCVYLAGAVLDCVPINHATVTGIPYDAAKLFVLEQPIFELAARHGMVSRLAQAQFVLLAQISVDDPVGLMDDLKRLGLQPVRDHQLGAHDYRPRWRKWEGLLRSRASAGFQNRTHSE